MGENYSESCNVYGPKAEAFVIKFIIILLHLIQLCFMSMYELIPAVQIFR